MFKKNIKGYKILTPNGYKHFDGIRELKNDKQLHIITEKNETKVTYDHPFVINNKTIKAQNLKIGDFLEIDNGNEKIIDIIPIKIDENVYDMINVDDNNVYYSNNILSHNCFFGSSYTLIDGDIIEALKKKILANYIEPETLKINNEKISIWEKPIQDHVYVLGADPSDGCGIDFSTICILDITTINNINQVASYNSNTISTDEFAYIIAKLGSMYNEAYVMCEANGIGRAVLNPLSSIYEYNNIFIGKRDFGIWSHNSIKSKACLWMKSLFNIEEVNIYIKEKHLINELGYFERKNKTGLPVYQAVSGKHDDFVMGFIWALFLLHSENIDNFYNVETYITTKNGLIIAGRINNPNLDNSINNTDYDKIYRNYNKDSDNQETEYNDNDFMNLADLIPQQKYEFSQFRQF